MLEEKIKIELNWSTAQRLHEYNEKYYSGGFSSFNGLINKILNDNEEKER